MREMTLTVGDFAHAFGVRIDEMPMECRDLIAKGDFRYRIAENNEYDVILLNVLKKLEDDTQAIGALERKDAWDKGWRENLVEFVEGGYELNKLVPKFFKHCRFLRLNQKYVISFNPNFEADFFSIFRLWFLRKYLGDCNSIYEFGCGTGFNLVALAQLYPDKELYGLDFVPSSVELVNKIAEVYKWNIKGQYFDMLCPDSNFKVDENSVFFTVGAVEQLASKFELFLQFILRCSPKICLHVEPTIELYDEQNLADYLAMKFHRKRGYSEGYLTRLEELEAENKLEILKVKRTYFGSLYMEGYSYIVWKPKEVAI
jgi:SAM-dependent methyltransferase